MNQENRKFLQGKVKLLRENVTQRRRKVRRGTERYPEKGNYSEEKEITPSKRKPLREKKVTHGKSDFSHWKKMLIVGK